MANELIINVTLGETRVARVENGVVTELNIDRKSEEGVVGNIYNGKVVRVMPGMQAAFVEIGLDRTAFLHAADVVKDLARIEEIDDESSSVEDELVTKPKKGSSNRHIENLLKDGAEILVQVEKEPLGTKGARVTSHISLPGRYLVYMPTVDHIGVSRRIGDADERMRLKKILKKLKKNNGGFIVRTVSSGVSEKELTEDVDYLTKMWKEIEPKLKGSKAPALIQAELDVISRVMRDQLTPDIDRVVVDSKDAFDRIEEFVAKFLPKGRHSVEMYDGTEPIFDAFGIEIEITRALGQKVWLKSGGYIIIEQTEALTAIDVNTGRFVGRRNVADTILKTNLEAVKEIVYQVKMRSMGGIIILDFIDMERADHRNKVYNTLKEALKDDKARTTITKISELGLVEMTRKRTREDLRHQLTNTCPYCEGKGYLKSPATICYEVFREISREIPEVKGDQLVVYCHPSVAGVLYDEERAQLEFLEARFNKRIHIKSITDYHLEQFDVMEK
ncbi:MAG: Rne/Rng family ribonuclease [Deltaproteobacteria bacterium]|jgi:ribonuclease G|nr:Rne/Rng family ribonuclease [Deltaproteobacteria bacterium]